MVQTDAQTDNQTDAMIRRDFADEVIPRETKARLAGRSGSLSPA